MNKYKVVYRTKVAAHADDIVTYYPYIYLESWGKWQYVKVFEGHRWKRLGYKTRQEAETKLAQLREEYN